jgi:TRAP-type mannitol/chloroaromatic compound transport system permease large subunit
VAFAWRSGRGPQAWVDRGVALVAIALAFSLGALAPSATVVTALFVLVGIAFLSGAPVFVVMGAAAMLLFWHDDTPIAAVPAETFRLVSSATLPAIPLLTVAGYVLAEGGAAKRLVRAYKGFFGWMPGGVAIMATAVCAVFTTFTGIAFTTQPVHGDGQCGMGFP